MKYLHLYLLLLCVVSASSQGTPLSARRDPSRSYQEYLTREPLFKSPAWKTSVEGQAKKYTEKSFQTLMISKDMESHPAEDLQEAYQWVRDLRFLTTSNHPDFKRRISWQYPDDGCFARAELALRQLKEHDFKGLKKIFAFGDLVVETSNAVSGEVTWWFHVAPLVKVGQEYFVIDPAISPKEILTVKQWLESMHVGFTKAQISVCTETAYDPGSDCTAAEALAEEEVRGHQSTYLHREWFRMVELGRDPELVLGDYPPWGSSQTKPDKSPTKP